MFLEGNLFLSGGLRISRNELQMQLIAKRTGGALAIIGRTPTARSRQPLATPAD
jgi:hypothetical protein